MSEQYTNPAAPIIGCIVIVSLVVFGLMLLAEFVLQIRFPHFLYLFPLGILIGAFVLANIVARDNINR